MGIQIKYIHKKWQELKLPQENLTSELKDPERNSFPRHQENPPQQPWVELKNHTDSDPEPSQSERSENTKDQLTCSSESYLSKDLLRILLMKNPQNSDSRAQHYWLSKKQLKHTWSAYSKTPTYAPSTL